MKKIIKKLLPWILTAIVLFFLFRSVPPAGVLKSITLANIPLFIFYSLIYFVAMMMVDCAGLKWAISRFCAPVSFVETYLMRGATYLLMLANYNAGQGSMAFYLKRVHAAPLFKTLGTIFFLTLVDLTIIVGPAVITALNVPIEFQGKNLNPLIINAGLIVYGGLFLWIALWQFLKTDVGQKFLQLKWLNWIYKRELFYTFQKASLKDYAKIYLLRLPPLLLVIASFFLWSHAFHITLPLVDIFVYAPIILIVGTLPITPGGIGAVQIFIIKLFEHQANLALPQNSPVSAKEILVAASLLWVVANAILKLVFGLYCLTKKSRSLFLDENIVNN